MNDHNIIFWGSKERAFLFQKNILHTLDVLFHDIWVKFQDFNKGLVTGLKFKLRGFSLDLFLVGGICNLIYPVYHVLYYKINIKENWQEGK